MWENCFSKSAAHAGNSQTQAHRAIARAFFVSGKIMAKKPTKPKAVEPEPVPVAAEAPQPVRAPIYLPAVHKALDQYRNDEQHASTVGRPSIERAAASLKALGVVSGLGDELQSCGSISEVIAFVKSRI